LVSKLLLFTTVLAVVWLHIPPQNQVLYNY
jgi:hypothetical protein